MADAVEKCFGYARVSDESQVKGDGFVRQEQAIRAYAKASGLKIERIFREDITGKRETMDRPEWRAMMLALLSDGVKTIVIEKLDRLSRLLLVQEVTIAELTEQGFRLVSTAEPDLTSNDPTRVAFRQMMGVFAEYDRSQIVLKLRGARDRKRAATGRCEGRKPYGERDGEHEVIRRMRDLRDAGAGYHTIADTLNSERVRPRSGRKWYPDTVRKILLRPSVPPHAP